ncbi:putative spermidine/putrescine transport system substrate-binding protein [Bosea sp. BE125]|uniref:ABC transporter substrate-binding protein n=1 Tax=Bosea sp. BE125 TaxID=2817909 RepID=UPI002854EF54|nr:ABC transporter substrate-binding protein [Bosea sp. BE125]MDR6869593.1 putative spermidine/putrescine transport system substrate-binding protein [Bosea sp. BE125]
MTDRPGLSRHPGLSRRSILLGGAGASLTIASPFVHVTPARADKGEIVVAGWGGSRTTAMREVMFTPFEKATGIRVRDDGPPEAAKVKAMVDSGNVTWDILDTDIPAILAMVNAKLLEPIDYSKLDKAKLGKIPPVLHHPYGLGHLIYSFNIVYNTKAFPNGTQPKTWADVWDGVKFKGARSFPFRGGLSPQLEFAAIADGVPADKVYPLDIERAWASHDKLRPLVTKWYANHAEAIQLLSSGEIDICCTIGPRGLVAKKDGAPIDVEFAGGKLAPDNWAIVKGARNAEAVYQFLNFVIDGKVQAELAKRIPYGPSSQDAFAHLSEAEAKELNTSPDNLAKQFWTDIDWWGKTAENGKTNNENQIERYARWMVKRG